MILPQRFYEAIRWLIAVVIPAFSVLLATLAGAWGWQMPLDAILVTIDAIALFLGTIFGISKLTHDKEVAAELEENEDCKEDDEEDYPGDLDPEQGV